jgi:hypothetical protein
MAAGTIAAIVAATNNHPGERQTGAVEGHKRQSGAGETSSALEYARQLNWSEVDDPIARDGSCQIQPDTSSWP